MVLEGGLVAEAGGWSLGLGKRGVGRGLGGPGGRGVFVAGLVVGGGSFGGRLCSPGTPHN